MKTTVFRIVKTEFPLAFFTYISSSFGKRINSGITDIIRATGVSGSAMPVDLFINLAQDYAEKRYNHAFLREVFSMGREVRLADICNTKANH